MILWWIYDVFMISWWCCVAFVMILWWFLWWFLNGFMMILWWFCHDFVMILWWFCDDFVMIVWWFYNYVEFFLVYKVYANTNETCEQVNSGKQRKKGIDRRVQSRNDQVRSTKRHSHAAATRPNSHEHASSQRKNPAVEICHQFWLQFLIETNATSDCTDRRNDPARQQGDNQSFL